MVTKTYDRQTAKFLAVLGENMPEVSSDIMQEWIENPKALQAVLRNVLCSVDMTATLQTQLSAWRSLKIGTHKSMQNLLRALVGNGVRISDRAINMFKKVPVAREATEIELVKLSVDQFGFPQGATREQIYERALGLGLDFIPAEAGPQLRLQYNGQPMGEWLFMGMEPIVDGAGIPRVFYVERDVDGAWLDTDSGESHRFWYSGYQWVFGRRRS